MFRFYPFTFGRRSALALRTVLSPTRRSISFTTSSYVEEKNKFYELRTYSIQPARYGEFLKLTAEKIHMRTAYSKMIGYWSSELGGMNEVTHLWEYDNFAHRSAVRKALAEDREWNQVYFSKILPMLASQTNMVLYSFPWYQPQLEPRKQFGSYELVLHTVIPGMMSELVHRVQQGLPSRLEMAYPSPLGFCASQSRYQTHYPKGRESGTVAYRKPLWATACESVCHIWPHENLDKRAEHRRELFHNEEWRETWRDTMKFMQGVQVKALVPTSFSPLQ